ncbi:MAG: DUF4405 domain-containing protein [Chlorobiaceae bacterium]|jgi:Domain of unknown function (DUF4405)
MNTIPLKSWTTPLAAGAFIISAVSGILIFFDIEMGIVEPVHKWLSWLLLVSVLFHLLTNWKQFTGYISQKTGGGIIGAALCLTILSILPFFNNDKKEHGKDNPGNTAAQALELSSLETIALVVRATPEQLVEQLKKKGIIVNNTSLTIREIAKINGKIDKTVLGTLLQATNGSTAKNSDND